MTLVFLFVCIPVVLGWWCFEFCSLLLCCWFYNWTQPVCRQHASAMFKDCLWECSQACRNSGLL